MTIEYLTSLYENPIHQVHRFKNRGIPETEIAQLEQLYNNGNAFPKVLKELLFLTGDFCYVFEHGITKSQQEMQEWVREDMEEMERIISRPFYAIDLYGGDQFMFVYLDEGDNPQIYQASAYEKGDVWIRKTSNTIKSLSEKRIIRVKEGGNPF
jgi:hypothetical protein